MAVSTCIKCSGHSFELALFTPLGDSRKLTIVQCSMCGTPVGCHGSGNGTSDRSPEESDRGNRRAAQPHRESVDGLIGCSPYSADTEQTLSR